MDRTEGIMDAECQAYIDRLNITPSSTTEGGTMDANTTNTIGNFEIRGELGSPIEVHLNKFDVIADVYLHAATDDSTIVKFHTGEVATILQNVISGITMSRLQDELDRIYAEFAGRKEGEIPTKRVPMSLRELASYLEDSLVTEKYPDGLLVTQDFGGHIHCQMDSNCPEVVKMRKFLSEAGLDIGDILKDWAKVKKKREGKAPDSPRFTFPDLSGTAKVNIAGKVIEVDLREELDKQLDHAVRVKWDNMRHAEGELQNLGNELYRCYIDYIHDARRQKSLAQLNFPMADLLKYTPIVNYASRDSYYIMFLLDYSPQWIWTHEIRHKLHKKHIEEIHREVYIVFRVTLDGKLLPPYLIDKGSGRKFVHYHGVDRDCWGELKFPESWKGTLKELHELAVKCQSALTTINRDSLMTHDPSGMPTVPQLLAKAKKVGKEDEIEKDAQEVVVDGESGDGTSSPRTWGVDAPREEQQEPTETTPEERRN